MSLQARCCAFHRRSHLSLSALSHPQASLLTTVGRIQLHWLESLLLLQCRACPFPDTSHFCLSSELTAQMGNRHGMPMLEANIRITEINERFAGIWNRISIEGFRQMLGWWRFFNTIIDQMAITRQSCDWKFNICLPIHRWNRSL